MSQVTFAVSTLGCPGLPIDRVAALLRRHGVPGVQLRCAADEPVHTGIDAADRVAVRRTLEDDGIALVGLATYVRLSEGAPGLTDHLELARDLGAPALRIMPGGKSGLVGHDLVESAARTLSESAAEARAAGVRLLVETHDAFLRGADLHRLLAAAGAGPEVGAIWDALHPWRAGEPPSETAAALGPWLAEVQIKDVASPEDRTPLVPGTGAVPLREVLSGYTGRVVLEHEARWYPDAAPIEEAIRGAQRVLGGTASHA